MYTLLCRIFNPVFVMRGIYHLIYAVCKFYPQTLIMSSLITKIIKIEKETHKKKLIRRFRTKISSIISD